MTNPQPTNQTLTLKDVSFSYPGTTKTVLSKVNVTLEKGKKYALIGPTGEGKSTLAMLMAGLVKPTSGQILYNNQDLQSYSRAQIADSVGFILQDPFLFQGTIKDNILYGGNLDETNLVELLLQKDLKNLIERFPEGLETPVSNNSENISLGQKQLPPCNSSSARVFDSRRSDCQPRYNHRKLSTTNSQQLVARNHAGHHCPQTKHSQKRRCKVPGWWRESGGAELKYKVGLSLKALN
jgi:ABC-type sugar transport system ATPase subunit